MHSNTDIISTSADSAFAILSRANIAFMCRDAGVDTACSELGDSATDDGEFIPNFDKSSSE